MTPCIIKECPGLATRGDGCAIHGTGLRVGTGGDTRKCERCQSRVKKGVWYRELDGGRIEHVKMCRKINE